MTSAWIVRGWLGERMEAEQAILRMAKVFSSPYRIYTEEENLDWDPGFPVDVCKLPPSGLPKGDKLTAVISLWDWMPEAWRIRAHQLDVFCIETEVVEGGCVVKER